MTIPTRLKKKSELNDLICHRVLDKTFFLRPVSEMRFTEIEFILVKLHHKGVQLIVRRLVLLQSSEFGSEENNLAIFIIKN